MSAAPLVEPLESLRRVSPAFLAPDASEASFSGTPGETASVSPGLSSRFLTGPARLLRDRRCSPIWPLSSLSMGHVRRLVFELFRFYERSNSLTVRSIV
jgi:hypothetical protein